MFVRLVVLWTVVVSIAFADRDLCFCDLSGAIDDCSCSVDAVDHFNNVLVFPRLQSLLGKPYFRYFQYNPHRPCLFWEQEDAKCVTNKCGVRSCQPDELPPGLACPEERHSEVDRTLDDSTRFDLGVWNDHHEGNEANFCDLDAEDDVHCHNCVYVDLTLNPERFTGYSGAVSNRIWKTIYKENCFWPPMEDEDDTMPKFSKDYLQYKLNSMCLEKRAFYRIVSGLHTSITIHLCANYLKEKKSSFSPLLSADEWGPNLDEFRRRFDPLTTGGQGPLWLRNLYFIYLLEVRALSKIAPYLHQVSYYTGRPDDDKETQLAVQDLLKLLSSFPDQFDEKTMFADDSSSLGSVHGLKKEFQDHFRNVSRILDCVTCDKCKLWGKLQITGLGTALKILFRDITHNSESQSRVHGSKLNLTRNEVVALLNAFGRISTSIQQLENFREMLKIRKKRDEL